MWSYSIFRIATCRDSWSRADTDRTRLEKFHIRGGKKIIYMPEQGYQHKKPIISEDRKIHRRAGKAAKKEKKAGIEEDKEKRFFLGTTVEEIKKKQTKKRRKKRG